WLCPVRHIGIGGIAMAGIIGIIKSSKIIGGAFKLAAEELFSKKKPGQNAILKCSQVLSLTAAINATGRQ
ncbi:MAG: hypothetical protein P8Y37_11030, partial [Anaerolineales bacterium]